MLKAASLPRLHRPVTTTLVLFLFGRKLAQFLTSHLACLPRSPGHKERRAQQRLPSRRRRGKPTRGKEAGIGAPPGTHLGCWRRRPRTTQTLTEPHSLTHPSTASGAPTAAARPFPFRQRGGFPRALAPGPERRRR